MTGVAVMPTARPTGNPAAEASVAASDVWASTGDAIAVSQRHRAAEVIRWGDVTGCITERS